MVYAHPKDTKKISFKLPLGGILFVVIILLGFITMQEPEIEFELSTEEIHQLILDKNETITPLKAIELQEFDNQEFRFVDLRNPHEFINGHIAGAINIPADHLLAEENLSTLGNNNFTNILYSGSHDMACGPWMMLRQLGFENNLILLGGFEIMNMMLTDNSKFLDLKFRDEEANYDYAQIVKEITGSSVSSSSQMKPLAKKVSRRKSKKGAQGGC
jgi:rhodanese-related sulfurtransferase